MFSQGSPGIRSFGDLAWHAPVRYATAGALPANTRTGNVLTASANGALSVDSNSPAVGDRILVKDEAPTYPNNGIYVVTDTGSAGSPWILTRAKDADTSAEMQAGSACWCEAGGVNQETLWIQIHVSPTLNVSNLAYVGFGLVWVGDNSFQLKLIGTNTYFLANPAVGGRAELVFYVQGEGYPRVRVAGDDSHSALSFGDGSAPEDVRLYRSAAQVLTLDNFGGPAALSLIGPRPTLAAYQFVGVTAASGTSTLSPVSSPSTIILPWAGRIVGVGVSIAGTRSAGSATARAVHNGSAGTLFAQINGTDKIRAYGVDSYAALDTFAAGDNLGAQVAFSSFAPSGSVALHVQVYVLFDAVG